MKVNCFKVQKQYGANFYEYWFSGGSYVSEFHIVSETKNLYVVGSEYTLEIE